MPCDTHWWISLISCLGQIPGDRIVRRPWCRWQVAPEKWYQSMLPGIFEYPLSQTLPLTLFFLFVFSFYFSDQYRESSAITSLVPWSRKRELGNSMLQFSSWFSLDWERTVFSLVAHFSLPWALSRLPTELVNTVGRAEFPRHTMINTPVSIWQWNWEGLIDLWKQEAYILKMIGSCILLSIPLVNVLDGRIA